MKAVILAAGRGERLGTLTADRPKCMVTLAGRPLLTRQLEVLKRCGIEDVIVVTGYRGDEIRKLGVRTAENPAWSTTNMVATLMCATSVIEGHDVLIAYSDIVYEPRVVQSIMASPDEIATVVDLGWRDLWTLRTGDPLHDAETMKIDAAGYIRELGKKPVDLSEIHGQYIGLTKVSAAATERFLRHIKTLDPGASFDGKDLPNMYMTSYLQSLIDAGAKIKAVPINHGWLEVDTISDLSAYEAQLQLGRLQNLYDPNA